jgi:hypothetical protein
MAVFSSGTKLGRNTLITAKNLKTKRLPESGVKASDQIHKHVN